MKTPSLLNCGIIAAGLVIGFLVTHHFTCVVNLDRPPHFNRVTLMAPDGHATKVTLEAMSIINDVNGHHHIFCTDGREVVWAYTLYIVKGN